MEMEPAPAVAEPMEAEPADDEAAREELLEAVEGAEPREEEAGGETAVYREPVSTWIWVNGEFVPTRLIRGRQPTEGRAGRTAYERWRRPGESTGRVSRGRAPTG